MEHFFIRYFNLKVAWVQFLFFMHIDHFGLHMNALQELHYYHSIYLIVMVLFELWFTFFNPFDSWNAIEKRCSDALQKQFNLWLYGFLDWLHTSSQNTRIQVKWFSWTTPLFFDWKPLEAQELACCRGKVVSRAILAVHSLTFYGRFLW